MDFAYNDVDSSEEHVGPLFDSENFLDIEENPDLSLQLLINCVYVCTCTILHDRKLIPEKSFRSFKVYDDVNGYLVDESDRNGLFVSQKYALASQEIFKKKLSKFALVVQTDEYSSPIEAFVWSFDYNNPERTTVRLGLNGLESTKFSINYKNMRDSCRQFCKMFCNLREILDDLAPLPERTFPSFRLAHFGDIRHLDGYDSINEFVHLDQFLVGMTRLPREHMTMTYGSTFANEQHIEKSTMTMGNTEFSEIQSTFEQTRQESFANEQRSNISEKSTEDSLLSVPPENMFDIQRSTVELIPTECVDDCSNTDNTSPISDGFSTYCEPATEYIQESVERTEKSENKKMIVEKSPIEDVYEMPTHEDDVFKKPKRASRRLTVPKEVTFAENVVSPIKKQTHAVTHYGRVRSLLNIEKVEKPRMFGRVRSLKELDQPKEKSKKRHAATAPIL